MQVADPFCGGPAFRDIGAFMSTPDAVSGAVITVLQDEPEVEGFLGWYTSRSLDPIPAWESKRFTAAGEEACP